MPATSVVKRTHRVQWMQRFMIVLTSGPIYLSSTARLFSLIARGVDAEGHRLVLQVAFAALVADRAIERMVDQQELHHAFAGLLDHRRVGEDFRRLAVRAGAQVAHAHGAGGLPASAARPSPRPGTCGSCRRSTAARGSRSAALPRPPPPPPAAACSGRVPRSLCRRPSASPCRLKPLRSRPQILSPDVSSRHPACHRNSMLRFDLGQRRRLLDPVVAADPALEATDSRRPRRSLPWLHAAICA